MTSKHYRTESEEETITLGAQFGAAWTAPKVVLLIGNLGAGKTTLAKGIAEGAGATNRNEVSSPTFPLIHEYGDPVRVYHVDLYRLDTLEEVATLGLDEILDREALVLLEWAERFPEILPQDRVEIRISALSGGSRELQVTDTSEPLC